MMKAQILDRLVEGRQGLGQVIRLVFIRVVAVMAFGLVLTLIFWLFWLENYAWGAFLVGAALGLSVFLLLNSLKKRLGLPKQDESSDASDTEGDLTDPGRVKSEAPVEK
jgi:hypothetical protein